MPSIEIMNYKVSTAIQRFSSGTQFERVLDLESERFYHGLYYRITLAFHTNFSGNWSSPVVGYLSETATFTPRIVGWLDLNEFNFYYEMLRSEKPVFLNYTLQSGTSGYLSKIGLSTLKEPLGEGPTDTSEALSIVRPDLQGELLPISNR
ncbi:hypothetical protein [Vampirovibrio sp.]|uniref:hypothetical protein n=1 Tax=Vampirovibrio sp. TaxID=2717857 RepID=UPI00359478A8